MVPGAVLWEAGGFPSLPEVAPPARADVVVIGGGYTGLAAARALAQTGAQVVVLEQRCIGSGASGRNGGFVLPGYKADLSRILKRHGFRMARALFDASLEAIAFVEHLVAEEGIDCDWHRPGSLVVASKPSHFAALRDEQEMLARDFHHPTTLLGPKDLTAELGASGFHGGLVDPTAGAVQPAAYVHGLAQAAARAGALICEGVWAMRFWKVGARWKVRIGAQVIEAKEVLVATNGYTRRLDNWVARRVVPVGSYIVATEPLDAAVAGRLIPRRRVVNDTRNLLHYFRLSHDNRLVFGGRAAFRPEALAKSVQVLGRDLVAMFPELRGVPLAFGWGGNVGMTRDHLPHVGRHDGLCYAVGYGGHGVAMASWLGEQVGRALGGRGGWPVLTRLPFPSIPLYRGRPWFLPAAGAYYRFKDWVS